jgi:hypothetical protein
LNLLCCIGTETASFEFSVFGLRSVVESEL